MLVDVAVKIIMLQKIAALSLGIVSYHCVLLGLHAEVWILRLL